MSSVEVSTSNQIVKNGEEAATSSRDSGSMSTIIVVARNAFREAVRDRILYNLVFFALILIAAALLLGDLTDGHQVRTIVNFGLSAMLIFGAFIAIFVGVGLVTKEIEKRTIFAIFAKPVRRGEFLLGKYFGLCATLAVNVAIMGVGVSLALLYAGGGNFALTIWAAVYLIFLQLAVLTAAALLFSSFSSPALSALLTFLIFIIGNLSASLRDFANALNSAAAQILFEVLYYVLPNFSHFSFITAAAHGKTPSVNQVLAATLYAVVYAGVLLTISIWIFSKRNFK